MKITKLPQSKSVFGVLDGFKEVFDPKYDNVKVVSDRYEAASRRSENYTDNWSLGNDKWGDAKNQIEKGYLTDRNNKSYEKTLAKAKGDMKPEAIAPVARRRRRRNEYDGEVCIDSYLAGSTDYYRKVTRVRTQNRVVRVILQGSFNAGTSAEDFQRYNAAGIAQAERLMRQGKIVEVYMAFSGAGFIECLDGYEHMFALVRIKEADRGADFMRMRSSSIVAASRYGLFRAAQLICHEIGGRSDIGLGSSINTFQNREMLNKFIKEASEVLQSEIVYFDGSTAEGREGIKSTEL